MANKGGIAVTGTGLSTIVKLAQRRWFINRLQEEFENKEKLSKENQNSQRGEIVKEIPMGDMSNIMSRISPKEFSMPKKF